MVPLCVPGTPGSPLLCAPASPSTPQHNCSSLLLSPNRPELICGRNQIFSLYPLKALPEAGSIPPSCSKKLLINSIVVFKDHDTVDTVVGFIIFFKGAGASRYA